MREQDKNSPALKLQDLYKDLMMTLEDSTLLSTPHRTKINNLLTLIVSNMQNQDARILDLESRNWDLQMKNKELKTEIGNFDKKPIATEREAELLNILNDSRKFFARVKNQCFVAAYGENLDDWARRVAEVSSNYDPKIPTKSNGLKIVA